MIDLPVDKKLRKQLAMLGAALGAVAGAVIAYLAYPTKNELPPDPKTLQMEHDVIETEDYLIPPPPVTREAMSVLFGILGGLAGAGVSRGFASDLQRKRDLKELINQGKKQK